MILMANANNSSPIGRADIYQFPADATVTELSNYYSFAINGAVASVGSKVYKGQYVTLAASSGNAAKAKFLFD
jgi:hypothetical protein